MDLKQKSLLAPKTFLPVAFQLCLGFFISRGQEKLEGWRKQHQKNLLKYKKRCCFKTKIKPHQIWFLSH